MKTLLISKTLHRGCRFLNFFLASANESIHVLEERPHTLTHSSDYQSEN
jgi:hypothetical protein